MKILMFGRGVIATTYGWALERAGHDVQFYVRPGRADAYGERVELDLFDLRRSMRGDHITQSWTVRYRESLEPDHDFDLIILSVAHHRLPEAVAFLAPRLSDATVLVFGNIWVEPLTAIGQIPADRVAWGFPGGGGGFGEDGTLLAAMLPFVVFGTVDNPPTERERVVRATFREAGFRLREQRDFRGWLWLHFVADAGIHSEGLRLGSLSRLVGNRVALGEALLTTRELLALVTVRGIDLRRHRGDTVPYRAPSRITAFAMSWAIRRFASLRRSLEAHTDGEAAEPREICRDVLTEAQRLGVDTPRLRAAEPLFE